MAWALVMIYRARAFDGDQASIKLLKLFHQFHWLKTYHLLEFLLDKYSANGISVNSIIYS